MLKKVCRQIGVFKWPYKETKLIARRQGRVIAASAPIPHDLRNINAAVASAATTSLKVQAWSPASPASSSSSGKRKSRAVASAAAQGDPASGNASRDSAAGAKRQRVATARADTLSVAGSSSRSRPSSSRPSSSRPSQHTAQPQPAPQEREEQLPVQDVGELAQSVGWDPDADDDDNEEAQSSGVRSSRANDASRQLAIMSQEHVEDEEREENIVEEDDQGEEDCFHVDNGIGGLWQDTMQSQPAQGDDDRRTMRFDTPPGLLEGTASDTGHDHECGRFESEQAAICRDRRHPVHGCAGDMYASDPRYSSAYGRLIPDAFARPTMAHACDMPSSMAMTHSPMRQVECR